MFFCRRRCGQSVCFYPNLYGFLEGKRNDRPAGDRSSLGPQEAERARRRRRRQRERTAALIEAMAARTVLGLPKIAACVSKHRFF